MKRHATAITRRCLSFTTLVAAACGGGNTPTPNGDFARAISESYGRAAPSNTANEDESTAVESSSASEDGRAAENAVDDSIEDTSATSGEEPTVDDAVAGEAEPESVASDDVPCDGFAIIRENCGAGGCHGGSSNLGNFAEDEAAARSYVGRSGALTCAGLGPIINPDDPSASILVQKLSDDPPCGNYMPPSASFLPPTDVACIESWIGSLK